MKMPTELDLDADAERVLDAARALAEARGEARVGAHLLLVALAQHGSPAVQAALSGLGLSTDDAEAWLAQAVGPLRVRSPFEAGAPYAERTAVILGIACAEAATAGAGSVRAADLLLGLVREPHSERGIAGAHLLGLGGTYDELKARMG